MVQCLAHAEVADVSELDTDLDCLWWGDEGFASMSRNAEERDHLAGVPSDWWPGSDESGGPPADALEQAAAEASYWLRSWQAQWVVHGVRQGGGGACRCHADRLLMKRWCSQSGGSC